MSEPGFASLGPSLLARKGGAKPAMRPQVAPLVTEESAVPEEQLEDLGWNDMGHDHGGHDEGAEIVPIHGDLAPAGDPAGPIVRRQQRRLEERVLADAAMTGPEDREPEYDEEGYDEEGYEEEDADESLYAPIAPAPAPAPAAAVASLPTARAKTRVPAAQSGRRAAFTLRLDADRHLKLRLAATMHGVSAQALVTEALDRLLAEYDDLDIIANHLKRH
jgi:hypothetical protein